MHLSTCSLLLNLYQVTVCVHARPQAKDEVAKACGSALSAQHKILKRAFKGPPGFTGCVAGCLLLHAVASLQT